MPFALGNLAFSSSLSWCCNATLPHWAWFKLFTSLKRASGCMKPEWPLTFVDFEIYIFQFVELQTFRRKEGTTVSTTWSFYSYEWYFYFGMFTAKLPIQFTSNLHKRWQGRHHCLPAKSHISSLWEIKAFTKKVILAQPLKSWKIMGTDNRTFVLSQWFSVWRRCSNQLKHLQGAGLVCAGITCYFSVCVATAQWAVGDCG